MSCSAPLPAWRTGSGGIILGASFQRNAQFLELPCGECTSCNMANAKMWALRCQLEMDRHEHATFATLTYADEHLPVTLSKRHLQLALKRIRKNAAGRIIRFFASGEYGERTQRPHYHAILYGLSASLPADAELIDKSWGLGHTRLAPITPARIAYVAGYTAKKADWKLHAEEERVDPDTGEVYTWQPPFIQMSRRPGIGSHARQWPDSWRSYAVMDGHKMPVPRYLHDAWLAQATEEEIQQLQKEKEQILTETAITYEQRQNKEKHNQARQAISADRRKY